MTLLSSNLSSSSLLLLLLFYMLLQWSLLLLLLSCCCCFSCRCSPRVMSVCLGALNCLSRLWGVAGELKFYFRSPWKCCMPQIQWQIQTQFTRPVCCCPCSCYCWQFKHRLRCLWLWLWLWQLLPNQSDKLNFLINNKFGKTTSGNRKESENAIALHIYMGNACFHLVNYALRITEESESNITNKFEFAFDSDQNAWDVVAAVVVAVTAAAAPVCCCWHEGESKMYAKFWMYKKKKPKRAQQLG